MSATILQIHVSQGGIPKRPIAMGIVTSLGLVGDSHAHPQIHGGPLKALLLLASESLEELMQQGYPLYPGALGENITTQGLDRRTVRLGQRYRIGEIEVEITKVRQPCDTLRPYGVGIQRAVYDPEVKAGNYASPRWGLAGFYTSVVRPGTIHPGDAIRLIQEQA
ncbi:MAG: MOSC domain-containing protein [Acidobacteriota bacterium]